MVAKTHPLVGKHCNGHIEVFFSPARAKRSIFVETKTGIRKLITISHPDLLIARVWEPRRWWNLFGHRRVRLCVWVPKKESLVAPLFCPNTQNWFFCPYVCMGNATRLLKDKTMSPVDLFWNTVFFETQSKDWNNKTGDAFDFHLNKERIPRMVFYGDNIW